jgi:hypothetical protein
MGHIATINVHTDMVYIEKIKREKRDDLPGHIVLKIHCGDVQINIFSNKKEFKTLKLENVT